MHTTEEKQYWRSLGQLNGTPEFKEWVEREFAEGASEAPQGTSRRNMLALMAASFGLAGLTACRRPEQHILPNAYGVEDYLPGEPLFYSTAMPLSGVAQGLLVRVNDGRPTKVEGNPEHPFSLGGANGYQQASVLGLYDPDRSQVVRRGGAQSDWDTFVAEAKKQIAGAGTGAGLRFLSERIASPSLAAIRDAALKQYPEAKWVEYEAIASDAAEQGAALAFGAPAIPNYQYDRAEVILALDSDFLGLDGSTVQAQKQFAKRRRAGLDHGGEHGGEKKEAMSTADKTPETPTGEGHGPAATAPSESGAMNRLYAVESHFSVTGAMADHRLRMRAVDVKDFAVKLANELNAFGSTLKVLQPAQGKADKFLKAVAKDLKNAKGAAVVVAGPRQPAEVHALAHLLNQAIGSVAVTYRKPAAAAPAQMVALKELVGEMAGGKVQTLVILSSNPVFTAPQDLNFADALKQVKTSIHVGPELDETAMAANWHVPEAHYLETWGDGRAPDGTVTIQQPMIQPLYGGHSAAEVVAAITNYKDQRGYDIVRNYWTSTFAKDKSDQVWRTALHSGIVPDSAYPEVKVTADAKKVGAALEAMKAPAEGFELVFTPSANVYDGRFANNAWLQEAADPMTKLVWDNAALISPGAARKLGIDPEKEERGAVLSIERNGQRVVMPCIVIPGHADDSVTLAVGYGRRECGKVGKGRGFNVYPLRTSDSPFIASGASVKLTGEPKYTLAVTQDHHSMEGRPLVRETTVEKYKEEPKVVEEMAEAPPLFSLFDEHSYKKGHQWGMAIDLHSCIGCNACVIACQAENNIPVVGKEQVLRGREMHWIRMDRYYTGSIDEAEAVMQPVPCMQCENAPCEAVCPVAATVHSPEGLNDMAYNRCVGTRYCSNNCPYKVRRFNFFNWHKGAAESEKMVHNPDVSVRMRGVMEKCTYCVQRIERARIRAHADWRNGNRDTEKIKDGEVTPACAQTCPSDAIVFGDINDPGSRVAQLKKQHRNYGMLEELNVRPRTTYLAKLRNVNPELSA